MKTVFDLGSPLVSYRIHTRANRLILYTVYPRYIGRLGIQKTLSVIIFLIYRITELLKNTKNPIYNRIILNSYLF